MRGKPEVKTSAAAQELEKAEKQLDAFESQVKTLTMDRMNEAPKADVEPQTKMAQKDIDRSKDVYLTPDRSIGATEKFNENYREEYNFAKEYVQFIAEHHELRGDIIEIWTKPFAGVPAQFWKVPTNKPVWAPRYVAEQIKRKSYHRLRMDQSKNVGGDPTVTYYGSMVVDSTIPRLDAMPVSSRRSVFMGAS